MAITRVWSTILRILKKWSKVDMKSKITIAMDDYNQGFIQLFCLLPRKDLQCVIVAKNTLESNDSKECSFQIFCSVQLKDLHFVMRSKITFVRDIFNNSCSQQFFSL